MVVMYRVSLLARIGAWALVTSPFVAMANLLAGREVVPERLVGRRGGALLADDLLAILGDSARWSATRAALGEVRARVAHEGVADRAARWALG
jgi:lipid-A-disaccharide synthase